MQKITKVEEFELINANGWLAMDLETTGLDPHKDRILLMSLCNKIDTWVIDFTVIPLEEIKRLAALLTSNLIINHNIVFDYKMLLPHGIEMKKMYDVMVVEQVLSAGKFVPTVSVPIPGKEKPFSAKPFSLAAIAYRRLGKLLKKDVREEFINYNGSLSDEAYEYSGEDVSILFEIYSQQMREIEENKLEKVLKLECALLPVIAYMEYTGVLLDIEGLQALEVPFKHYIDKCEKLFQDMVISHGGAERIVFGKKYSALNTSSKDQVIRALNLCGLDIDTLDSKKLAKWDLRKSKSHVDLEILNTMLGEDTDIAEALDHFGGYSNPFLRAYSFLVGAEKLLGTYVEGLQKKARDKVFYPYFRQCGARNTGRYSSDAQQIPQDRKLKRLGVKDSVRKCIIARPKKKLIIADFSAIELVILADYSNDQRLIYEHSVGDLHLLVTKEVMGKFWPIALQITPENKGDTPFKNLRDFSKILSYGIAYGVTGKSLADQATTQLAAIGLKFSSEEGDLAVSFWKQLFPEAGKFLDQSASMAITQGFTESRLGRKRFFDLEYVHSNKWRMLAARREGSNQRIQSTSADITKTAMLYFFNMANRNKARIVLSIHDELVVEADEEYAETAKYLLEQCMEKAAQDILPNLGNTVKVEAHISDRYDK